LPLRYSTWRASSCVKFSWGIYPKCLMEPYSAKLCLKEELPASIVLYVDYPFPPEPKQEMNIFGTMISNELLDNRQLVKDTEQTLEE
jgi:hypothetical protein